MNLIAAAMKARKNAYARYSNFAVGAALRTVSGVVFTGCNVENSAFGESMCAERVAVFAAVAAGERRFSHIAIIADCPAPLTPCGSCRQVLAEFDPDLVVIMANLKGQVTTKTARELLPLKFEL